jgi:glycosyltransferase involved in cell wall biosynthesis
MSGRWHILDGGLRHEVGHSLEQARSLVGALARRGIAATVYTHAQADRGLLEGVPAVPLFRTDPQSYEFGDDVAGELEDFVLINTITRNDLDRLDRAAVGPEDVAFFSTVTMNQLLAIVQWADAFEPGRGPKIVLRLLMPPRWSPMERAVSRPGVYYRYAWRTRRRDRATRLFLGVETEAMARAYEPLFDARPAVLPMIAELPAGVSAEAGAALAGRQEGESLICYLGNARTERGFALLPEIVARGRAAGGRLRYFIQCDRDAATAFGEIERQLAACPEVTLHRGQLDAQHYFSLLRAADLALVPYHPLRYRVRGSGVYAEASLAGAPVIVPAATWMAEEVEREGNGAVFADFSAAAVAAAIGAALPRLAELRAAARRHGEKQRSRHGTDAFIDFVDRLGQG